MNRVRAFLSSSRRELAVELLFAFFGVLTRNELLRFAILVAGFFITAFMAHEKHASHGGAPERFKLLLAWIIYAVPAYIVIPLLFVYGSGANFGVLLTLATVLLFLPIMALGGRAHRLGDYEERGVILIGSLTWAAGAMVAFVGSYMNSNVDCVAIPLHLVAIVMAILASKSGVWLTANIIAGEVYAHLWLSLVESGVTSISVPAGIAALTAAMITGLSLLVILEE